MGRYFLEETAWGAFLEPTAWGDTVAPIQQTPSGPSGLSEDETQVEPGRAAPLAPVRPVTPEVLGIPAEISRADAGPARV